MTLARGGWRSSRCARGSSTGNALGMLAVCCLLLGLAGVCTRLVCSSSVRPCSLVGALGCNCCVARLGFLLVPQSLSYRCRAAG